MIGVSAYLNTISRVRSKTFLCSFENDYDESEILKMSKNGILSFFKLQLRAFEEKTEIQLRAFEEKTEIQLRAFEEKTAIYKNQIADKDTLIAAKDTLTDLKLSIANSKYLKLKGNLNVRGLIEEFEQSDPFQQCRKMLAVRVSVMDQASNKTTVENRQPSRMALWNEVLKDSKYSSLLACIANANPDRRDTVGERIRDLYTSVSKGVHKPGESDVVLILKSGLYDHQVSDGRIIEILQ
jgi:hypothetical protein